MNTSIYLFDPHMLIQAGGFLHINVRLHRSTICQMAGNLGGQCCAAGFKVDPGQLVGEGDNGDVAMGAAHESFRPSAERRVALGDVRQRGARPMHQKLAEICVAALADPERLQFAAGGELPRDNAQPGRKITASITARPRGRARKRRSRRTRGSSQGVWRLRSLSPSG